MSLLGVWSARPGPAEVAALAPLLSPDERAGVARLRTEADRARSTVGRGGARLLLGAELGVDPRCVDVRRDADGKPRLGPAHPGGLAFSTAHSGRVVLVALARGATGGATGGADGDVEVGVDVEEAGGRVDVEAVAARFFSAAERSAVAAAPAEQRAALALACWVRKEAHLKALGTGLRAALDGFDVVEPVPGGGWAFRRRVGPSALLPLVVEAGHVAALALTGPAPPPTPVRVRPLLPGA